MNFGPNHATGFTVSALFHGAILASFLYGQTSMQHSLLTTESRSLSLAMFQLSQPTVAEKSVAVESTQAPAQSKPEPKLKSKPDSNKPLPTITKKPIVSQPIPLDKTAEKPIDKLEELADEKLTDQAKEPDENMAAKDGVTETQSQPSPPDSAIIAPGAPALDHGIIESLEANYKIALRNAIEAHKFYPRRAKRLKREGKVIIDFTINRNGLIHNVHIAQTSGTNLLDKAALDAVNKLGQFKPIPEQIPRPHWKLEVPMEFTLL